MAIFYATSGDDTVGSTPDDLAPDTYILGSGSDNFSSLYIVSGDTVYGGPGDDRVSVVSQHYLYGGSGDDTLHADSGGYISGGSGDDNLTADSVLVYGAFDTTISGGSGNDTISSGVFDSLLIGGSGEDDVKGGDGSILKGGSGDDVLFSATLIAGATLRGGTDNDELRAGTGGDLLKGDSGDDSFVGNSNATMIGGSGNDYFIDGIIDYSDKISGGSGNDSIFSSVGSSAAYTTISGGAGDDYIHAGGRALHIHGGSGADTFEYIDFSVSNLAFTDRIFDFTQGEDNLFFSMGTADDFVFLGLDAFDSADNAGKYELRYEKQTFSSGYTRTLLQADSDGDGDIDMQIQFSKQLIDFTMADFTFVV